MMIIFRPALTVGSVTWHLYALAHLRRIHYQAGTLRAGASRPIACGLDNVCILLYMLLIQSIGLAPMPWHSLVIGSDPKRVSNTCSSARSRNHPFTQLQNSMCCYDLIPARKRAAVPVPSTLAVLMVNIWLPGDLKWPKAR